MRRRLLIQAAAIASLSLGCARAIEPAKPAAATAVATPAPVMGPEIAATQIDLFTGGVGGYATYRIPTLIKAKSGALLLFVEARKTGKADAGDIDLMMRKSTDAGKTWSAPSLIWDAGADTAGNPVPVVDQKTGRVILICCWNKGTDKEKEILAGRQTDTEGRHVYMLTSDNEGGEWSKPREITDSVKKPEWGWYATGPCHAIQLKSGRIVVPANHSDKTNDAAGFVYSAHVFFSDDGGANWMLGGTIGPKTNESTIAELPDGSLVMNMRSYENMHQRAISKSTDGGVTWSAPVLDPQLVEPRCQGSLLAVDHAGAHYYLFSNPAAITRSHMSVKWSGDNMKTWNPGLLVNAGFSGYSDMAMANEDTFALAYERGNDYARISLLTASLGALLGAPSTTAPGALIPPTPTQKEK